MNYLILDVDNSSTHLGQKQFLVLLVKVGRQICKLSFGYEYLVNGHINAFKISNISVGLGKGFTPLHAFMNIFGTEFI